MSTSIKCPKCGLTNFADAETCKRCSAELATVQAAVNNPKLTQCPDCAHPVSNQAESCPNCGRFFRVLRSPVFDRDRRWWAYTIGWGVLASGFILFLISVCILFLLMLLTGLFAMGR